MHNYSIFFDEEIHVLFGYPDIESEEKWETISENVVCKRWWKYIADIMIVNEDNS